MTAEQLIAIAGAILSLAFSYIPGLKTRCEPLSLEMKRLVLKIAPRNLQPATGNQSSIFNLPPLLGV